MIHFIPMGPGREYRNGLGANISYGYSREGGEDITRKQLAVYIGLWWVGIKIVLWQEKCGLSGDEHPN